MQGLSELASGACSDTQILCMIITSIPIFRPFTEPEALADWPKLKVRGCGCMENFAAAHGSYLITPTNQSNYRHTLCIGLRAGGPID